MRVITRSNYPIDAMVVPLDRAARHPTLQGRIVHTLAVCLGASEVALLGLSHIAQSAAERGARSFEHRPIILQNYRLTTDLQHV